MAELKPCPFCGGEAFKYFSGNPSCGYFLEIICKNCGCQTTRLHEAEAIKLWNRRADNG